MAAVEKFVDRQMRADGKKKRKERGTLVVGGCLNASWSSSDSDCDGDGGIHVLSKAEKQDIPFLWRPANSHIS